MNELKKESAMSVDVHSGARMLSVIETALARRGDGRRRPVRVITQYWSTEGELLAEVDPTPDSDRERERMRSALEEIVNHVGRCLDGGRHEALEQIRTLAIGGLDGNA